MFGKKNEKNDEEIFVYYDSKSKSYGRPMFAKNKETIMRDILNMFRDKQEQKSQLFVNAEDFSLFRIGGYSQQTGQIEAQNLEHMVNLHDLRSLASEQQGIVST